jgi:hypothetical protein
MGIGMERLIDYIQQEQWTIKFDAGLMQKILSLGTLD